MTIKSSSPKKLSRCRWVTEDQIYIDYHDEEWGVPTFDDRTLFEFLILEGAQAGLSWITVLKKRERYRQQFLQFDPKKIARFTERDVVNLLKDPGIIRNQLKVRSAIINAKAYLDVCKEWGSFAKYIWHFVEGKPLQNKRQSHSTLPASTPISDLMSKDLKKRGFKFVGTTICYAYMQAVGMVNDHTVDCYRHREIKNALKKDKTTHEECT